MRDPDVSFPEYDDYWKLFWEERDLFRTDLRFTKFDVHIEKLSPFEFKQQCIISRLSSKIESHNFQSVLEIGSGAGLNLMFLAPKFPDVQFYGLEPTYSGVFMANEFINSPPKEFKEAHEIGKLENVHIIKGSILDKEVVEILKKEYSFDFVFTSAVLEQLLNFVDIVFPSIFSIPADYFLFNEEWLEGNYLIDNYKTLVDSDYFRISWNYLNSYKNIQTLERVIEPMQPAWLKYTSVFCKKI